MALARPLSVCGGKSPKSNKKRGIPPGVPPFCMAFSFLGEGVLGLVEHALGLVEADVLDAQQLEQLEEGLAVMAKGHGAVVGLALLHQHVAVVTAHLGDGEHADAAEGAGGHRQDLALCHVAAELAVSSALQAVEGDFAGGDVAF